MHLTTAPNCAPDFAPDFDTTAFRNLMGRFATGVAVLTFTQADGTGSDTIGATTINAFMSVSLEPALVLVSVRTGGRFDSHVTKDTPFGISFLGASQQDISHRFAGKTPAPTQDRVFTDLEGTPVITGALAQMRVTVQDIHPAGDHQLYVCRVTALKAGDTNAPLLFFSGQYATL